MTLLITVDSEQKNELFKELDKIKKFSLSTPFEKVSLVEKEWYDGLIDWLQSSTIPPPGKIRVKKLFSNQKFDSKLKLHKDFEIISYNIWEKLFQIFGSNGKLFKYCRRHPETKKLTILISPIILTFSISPNKSKEEEIIKEVVDTNWNVYMIKDYICRKYKIKNNSDYLLFQNDEELLPSETCGEIKERSKSQIKIQKKIIQHRVFDSISDKYTHYPLQKNINNLPLPVEVDSQNKQSKKNSRVSNLIKAPSIKNKNGYQNQHRNIYITESDSDSYEYSDSTPPIKKPISRLENKVNPMIINNSKIIKPTSGSSHSSSSNSTTEQSKNNNCNVSPRYLTSITSTSAKTKRDENENCEEIQISRPISKWNSSTISFPKPCGLNNLGNTCFFNAAVQCLVRCQPLTNFILSSQCQSQINLKNPLGTKGRIVNAYRDLLQKMATASNSSQKSNHYYSSSTYMRYGQSSYLSSYLNAAINPSNLHSIIAHQYPIFEDFGQNDAQELVGSLLDGLHEDLNQSHQAKGNNPPTPLPKDPDSYEVYLSKNSSPIMDIFNGKLFHSIKCPSCGHKRVVYDPFMFLSLPIPSNNHSTTINDYTSTSSRYGYSSYLYSNNRYTSYSSYKKVTLADCFDSFAKSEALDVHNLWKCDSCSKEVNATVKSGISKTSDILIIHLKRFDGQSYYMKKIDTPVDYPETIDSSFFQNSMNLSASGIQNSIYPKYNLIGVVFHHGSLSGGHYTSAARDPETNKWYEFNDSSVTQIQKEDAHSSNAYILFYQKC